MTHSKRPLSPHLQIYKPQMTSVLSILHRFAGVALSTGLLALVYWIYAVAAGANTYEVMLSFYQGFVGKILLIGWCVSFFYHLCNGIRHLVWDMGHGFELPNVYVGGWIVLATTALFSAISLVFIF